MLRDYQRIAHLRLLRDYSTPYESRYCLSGSPYPFFPFAQCRINQYEHQIHQVKIQSHRVQIHIHNETQFLMFVMLVEIQTFVIQIMMFQMIETQLFLLLIEHKHL